MLVAVSFLVGFVGGLLAAFALACAIYPAKEIR